MAERSIALDCKSSALWATQVRILLPAQTFFDIKYLTNSAPEKEIKEIWEMGKSREVGYDTSLIAAPENIEETTQELSGRYSLGIVTSRTRESIYEAPQLAKLKKHFQVVVSYDDTKHHKPHPEPLLCLPQKESVCGRRRRYTWEMRKTT